MITGNLHDRNLGPIGIYTPVWPDAANGIVRYVRSIRPAMQRRLGRCVVIARKLSGPVSDTDVVDLSGRSEPSHAGRGILRRVRRWGVRLAGCERSRHDELLGSMIDAIDRLAAEGRVRLVEIEESFGWATQIAPHVSVPVVVRLHGPWFLNGDVRGVPQDAAFADRVRAEGLGLTAAAGVSAVSLDVLQRVREHYNLELPDACVIPNPIEPVPADQRWRLDRCDRDAVLFIGRFDRHKGADVMLEAFERIVARRPQTRLIVIGPDSGVLDDAGQPVGIDRWIERNVTSASARRAIAYLGPMPIDRLNEHRRRAMVTVTPSRYETFGYTALEAMSIGCPLVSTAAGGLGEIVEDGVTALCCDADDADALADRVLRILEDPALGERLGAAAVEAAHRFAPDRIVDRAVAFFGEVAGRFGSGSGATTGSMQVR